VLDFSRVDTLAFEFQILGDEQSPPFYRFGRRMTAI
jgi:hypothetical protein